MIMNCKNCKKELLEESDYCNKCGAKIIRNRLTPRVLIQQVNEEFWTVDNKFALTFIALFKKPESVINGYINGTRKRYIGVIPYYALALTVLGFQYFLLQNVFIDFFTSQTNALLENLPENQEIPNFNNLLVDSMDKMNDYISIVTSITVPFWALGTWLTFIDKNKHNYTEHLVINLYANAQILLITFVLIILFATIGFSDFLTASLLTTPLVIGYSSYVFKRIYKISYFNALIRFLGAFFIYLIAFSIISILIVLVIVIYAFATGKF